MPRNNKTPDYETLLEFQNVYLRAIALAWTDDEFKRRLLDDASLALQDYYGYKLPWTVRLSVESVDEKVHGWNSREKRWNLPRDTISVGIPEKPGEDSQPVALAAYNDAGPTYLFTCC
ncbi:BMA_0021/BMA_0022 family TOMM bacteriocin [Endothiovibrio diazotrophicus]